MMKFLQIEKRLLRLFYIIFTINLCISILKGKDSTDYTGMLWFLNLTVPVWLSISGGSILGLLVYVFPQPVTDAFTKLIRSMVIGTMIITFLMFVFYLYDILLFFSIQQP